MHRKILSKILAKSNLVICIKSSTSLLSWTHLNNVRVVWHLKSISVIHHIHNMKKKKYDHFNRCRSIFDKIQHQVIFKTLSHMHAFQKSTSNKCWRGCGEKGILLHCWWECKPVQPLWRTVWRFLKKLELELPYDPAIPLLGIHTEETRIERDTCTPMFIAALFTIARTWKQPRCPLADEWIKKKWYPKGLQTMDAGEGVERREPS